MTVTHSNSKVETFDFRDAPPERYEAPGLPKSRKSKVTDRDAWRRFLAAVAVYVTPPSVLTERPASVAELATYAHRAGWTSQNSGPVRAAGILWHRAVGLPITVVCRYVEWIAQRPGRAVAAFGLWKLFVLSGAGVWMVHHLINPVGAVAGWLFL